MEEKTIKSMDEDMLSPFDLITIMFERTDQDGILHIPAFNESGEDYRCRVDWNLQKYERLLKIFEEHYNSIKDIARFKIKKGATHDSVQNILKKPELVDFWNTYIRAFDIGDIDFERILDIDDRLEIVDWIKQIAEKLAGGKELSENDRRFLGEYINITVTDEEELYRERYVKAIYADSEKRLGKRLCSYDLIVHSMRLCRLLNLGAPEVVILHEACAVAASMLLYEYGISRECVDNTVRLQIERMELMSEEELDELYRPKKTNTRKSMAPLFVYSILKEKSDSKNHLRQQEILDELKKYPYELILERKALGRVIHNLIDSPQYAVFQDRTGVWIDQSR